MTVVCGKVSERTNEGSPPSIDWGGEPAPEHAGTPLRGARCTYWSGPAALGPPELGKPAT